ncbi:MAG: DUF4258 domain-containing protein [Owenweeksia sp.]|nr:DUF4258 domain-containing protein [Owenweeksia sp.]
MKFIRKLMYFLLGTGLGVLLVIFIFGDRDIECSYFPNDRVLYDLRKKEMRISGQARQMMDERQLDTAQISMMLLGGEVDFERSDPAMKIPVIFIGLIINPKEILPFRPR